MNQVSKREGAGASQKWLQPGASTKFEDIPEILSTMRKMQNELESLGGSAEQLAAIHKRIDDVRDRLNGRRDNSERDLLRALEDLARVPWWRLVARHRAWRHLRLRREEMDWAEHYHFVERRHLEFIASGVNEIPF